MTFKGFSLAFMILMYENLGLCKSMVFELFCVFGNITIIFGVLFALFCVLLSGLTLITPIYSANANLILTLELVIYRMEEWL